MTGCTDCGVEQRTINEKLQLTIRHAQEIANTENKAVAICVEGQGFTPCVITGIAPGGTVHIVKPVL